MHFVTDALRSLPSLLLYQVVIGCPSSLELIKLCGEGGTRRADPEERTTLGAELAALLWALEITSSSSLGLSDSRRRLRALNAEVQAVRRSRGRQPLPSVSVTEGGAGTRHHAPRSVCEVPEVWRSPAAPASLKASCQWCLPRCCGVGFMLSAV